MNQKIKFLFLILFFGNLMLFPFSSLAGEYKLNDGTIVHYEGLVPCGYDLNKDGEMQYYENCQLCHFFVMGKGILDFVLEIIIIIAVLMFVYGGITFIIATGDPGKFSKGKDIIQAAVIGLVIIFAAWIIVNTIFLLIGVADWTGLREGWFKIDCPITIASLPTPPLTSGSCETGCDFLAMGPCTADKPNITSVSGGVCCCPDVSASSIDLTLNLNFQGFSSDGDPEFRGADILGTTDVPDAP